MGGAQRKPEGRSEEGGGMKKYAVCFDNARNARYISAVDEFTAIKAAVKRRHITVNFIDRISDDSSRFSFIAPVDEARESLMYWDGKGVDLCGLEEGVDYRRYSGVIYDNGEQA